MSEYLDRFLHVYIIFVFFMMFLVANGLDEFATNLSINVPVAQPPTDNFITNLVNWVNYFLAQIGFYFELMTVSSDFQILNFIVFSPAITYIAYFVLVKILMPIISRRFT